MPQSSYPDGDALKAKLEAAGLTAPDDDTLTIYASAGVDAFNKAVGREMLAGGEEARYYTPPCDSRTLFLPDDVVGTPAVVYRPYGSSPMTLTAGTDYRFDPVNAPGKGRPYTALNFLGRGSGPSYWCSPLGSCYENSIEITGQFGYGLTLPDSVWSAMVALGAAALAADAQNLGTGGIVSWGESTHSAKYADFDALSSGWTAQAKAVIQQYRRVRI